VIVEEKYSPTVDRHFVHTVLRLGHSYEGPTEIGGLIVLPEFRLVPERVGMMISYVRFLFMAMHRGLFRNEVVAELLPPLLPDGRQPPLGGPRAEVHRHELLEADRLSKRNKEFIKSLFPAGDVYASLLPQDAQDVIGKVGRETRGVEKMLRRIGEHRRDPVLQRAHRIDPFDGLCARTFRRGHRRDPARLTRGALRKFPVPRPTRSSSRSPAPAPPGDRRKVAPARCPLIPTPARMGAPAKRWSGRLLRAALKPAALTLPLLCVARGGVRDRDALDVLAAALLVAVLCANVLRRKGFGDTWTAVLALALAVVLVDATGGVGGPLGSLPLVVVAAAVALGRRAPWAPVGVALVGEVALHASATGSPTTTLAARAALLLAAAGLHHALTRAEIRRVREDQRRAQQEDRRRKQDAALSLRITPAEGGARASGHDAARERASLDEVHASLVGLLTLVRRSMGLRTCALFWLSPGGGLRLVEAATDDDLITAELPQGGGALGAVIRLGQPVLRAGLREDCAAVTWYVGPSPAKALAAVPVRDGDEVRGVFVGDRDDDRAFTDDDRAVLDAAALQARRLIDNERVFSRLERARSELSTLFTARDRSARRLRRRPCSTPWPPPPATPPRPTSWSSPPGKTACTACSGCSARRRSRCRAARSATTRASPAPRAARARCRTAGQFDPATQHVFTREHPWEGDALGALCPAGGARRGARHAHPRGPRRGCSRRGAAQLLGVLASGASVALANAAAVRRLEELATTDPMTGHLNKRALETEFEKRLRAAARFVRPLGAGGARHRQVQVGQRHLRARRRATW
jgi:GAF domain-containing protein